MALLQCWVQASVTVGGDGAAVLQERLSRGRQEVNLRPFGPEDIERGGFI